ncbi:hypothetical protein IWX49DRAFT_219569 [Phyllosticta citricarpa]
MGRQPEWQTPTAQPFFFSLFPFFCIFSLRFTVDGSPILSSTVLAASTAAAPPRSLLGTPRIRPCRPTCQSH